MGVICSQMLFAFWLVELVWILLYHMKMQKIKLNGFQYPITRVMRNPITADDKGWGWMLPPSMYTDIHLWGLGMLGTEGRTVSLWAFLGIAKRLLVQTCSVHVKVDGSANSLPHLEKEVLVHA